MGWTASARASTWRYFIVSAVCDVVAQFDDPLPENDVREFDYLFSRYSNRDLKQDLEKDPSYKTRVDHLDQDGDRALCTFVAGDCGCQREPVLAGSSDIAEHGDPALTAG